MALGQQWLEMALGVALGCGKSARGTRMLTWQAFEVPAGRQDCYKDLQETDVRQDKTREGKLQRRRLHHSNRPSDPMQP